MSEKQKRDIVARRDRDLRNRGRARFGALREGLLWDKCPGRSTYTTCLKDYGRPEQMARFSRDPDFLIAWALNGRELPPGVTHEELEAIYALGGYAAVDARVDEALGAGV